MSAALQLMPARASSSKMGKPVNLFEIVPGKDRHSYKHKIFWAKHHTRTADQYNSIVTVFKHPCPKRWLEFIGGRVPKGMAYATCYSPDPIKPRPVRFWTLLRDGEPYACYTNCVECWMLVLSGEHFGTKHKWSMLYTDRSGR